MEAKEIRIGNLIQLYRTPKDKEITFHKIVSIGYLDNFESYCVELEDGFTVNVEGISGIPLTEERLIKFGWIWNKETNSFEKLGFPNGHIKKTSFGWTMFNYVLKSLTTNRDFHYVHQLQNLYFELKREELIIDSNHVY